MALIFPIYKRENHPPSRFLRELFQDWWKLGLFYIHNNKHFFSCSSRTHNEHTLEWIFILFIHTFGWISQGRDGRRQPTTLCVPLSKDEIFKSGKGKKHKVWLIGQGIAKGSWESLRDLVNDQEIIRASILGMKMRTRFAHGSNMHDKNQSFSGDLPREEQAKSLMARKREGKERFRVASNTR